MLLELIASQHPAIWIAASTMGVLGMLVVLWRLWKFTLLPALHPREPKELPYWIPVLGHTLEFVNDSHALLTRGRNSFEKSREPFAITLGGEQLYVLTSAEDVAQAYKNTSSLDFQGAIRDVLSSVDASPALYAQMFHQPCPSESGSPRELLRCHSFPLAQICQDLYIQQLVPGERLDKLSQKLIHSVDELLQWERMPHLFNPQSKSREMNISLVQWSEGIMIDAMIISLFGPRLFQIDPTVAQTLFDFNEEAWKSLFRYPRLAAKKVYAAMDKVTDAFEVYFQLPKEERTESAWLVQELEVQQTQRGVSLRDQAKLALLMLWVSSANTSRLCFWVMAYLVHDPSLMAAIRSETRPAMAGNTFNPSYSMENCPRLNALYQEILRISNASASLRTVTAPTEIGGKLLKSGIKVIMPCQQLHRDENAWGINANQYDPERFLKNGKLRHSPSFRPFGGGKTQCPGRHLAKQEIFSFITLALHRFQIGLAQTLPKSRDANISEGVPRFDHQTPCMGIMGPLNGTKVMINIKEQL